MDPRDPRDPLLLTYSGSTGHNWLARVLITAAGLFVAVTAFFFLTVALVVGALVVAIIAVRVWWVMRRIRAQQEASGPLEGDYTIVKESDARGPVNARRQSNDPY
jgi:predicted lipid-binding transport protein (Tim44 family)